MEPTRSYKKVQECVGHACRGLAPMIAEIVPVIADKQRYAYKQRLAKSDHNSATRVSYKT